MAYNMEHISEELKVLKRIESLLTDSETDTESQTSNSTTMTQRSEQKLIVIENHSKLLRDFIHSKEFVSRKQLETKNNELKSNAIKNLMFEGNSADGSETLKELYELVESHLYSNYQLIYNENELKRIKSIEKTVKKFGSDFRDGINEELETKSLDSHKLEELFIKYRKRIFNEVNESFGEDEELMATITLKLNEFIDNSENAIIVKNYRLRDKGVNKSSTLSPEEHIEAIIEKRLNEFTERIEHKFGLTSIKEKPKSDIKHKKDIEIQTVSKINQSREQLPEENIACSQFNAVVLKGENPNALLNGDSLNYDKKNGFTYHYIDGDLIQEILIKLGKKYVINHMKMLLCDKDFNSYSYYIEVSKDCIEWDRVVDYTSYLCRSWQCLCFTAQLVQFIRIVGTRTKTVREFKVVSFECMYTNREVKIERGIVVPKGNVAYIGNNACVIEGKNGDNLINGNYIYKNIYTSSYITCGPIVVQLCQPFLIDSMRLLLKDDQNYSYYVEVSVDQQNWHIVADKRNELCSSWQVLTFTPIPVVFIRIKGTQCSIGSEFMCVYFECPKQELENTK